MKNVRVFAGGLLALTVLAMSNMAGCTGGPTGTPTPTPTGSPSPSPSPTATPTPTPTPTGAPSTFLVVETDGEGVVGFDDPASLDGPSVPVDTQIGLVNTGVSDIAVDGEDHLFVALMNDNKILIFENARTSSDPDEPARTLEGDATELNFPRAIAIDKTADVLYFANDPLNFRADIRVFDNVSDAAFDGNIAPDRTFHTAADTAFHPLQLFAHDGDLWVVDDRDGDTKTSILVFNNATTLEGEVAPNRTIFSALLGDPIAIFVDNQNRLFAVDQTNQVRIWNNADTADGDSDGDIEVVIDGAQRLNHVVVDENDTMYLADGFNVIYEIDNVSGFVSGQTVEPSRTVEGPDLSSPDKLELLEP
jgi:hypothetical protein